jgi:hypothetical protein
MRNAAPQQSPPAAAIPSCDSIDNAVFDAFSAGSVRLRVCAAIVLLQVLHLGKIFRAVSRRRYLFGEA